jgi:type IV secretion system protein VirB10
VSDDSAQSGGLPKVDPEKLVLRSPLPRVTRFRKAVIVTAIAGFSAALAATAWISLRPGAFSMMSSEQSSAQPAGPPAPDALANAPRDYGDVPRLGPPLPGDLGRPIVESAAGADLAGTSGSQVPAAQAQADERARRVAEQSQALRSALLVQSSNPPGALPDAGSPPPPTDAEPPRPAMPVRGPAAGGDANLQGHKLDFVEARAGAGEARGGFMQSPSGQVLSAGSVIAAGLMTGLDSDLPGIVTAQVTQGVYDSSTGRVLLIPQGSRLIGRYDSSISFGQSRALVAWDRIVLPDGSSITLQNETASDTAGYAGLSDRVDQHTGRLAEGAALATLLGAGAEIGFGDNEADLVRAIRESGQENVGRAGDRIVARQVDVQPTIRVRPGWPLRVIVRRDIVLPQWRGY